MSDDLTTRLAALGIELPEVEAYENTSRDYASSRADLAYRVRLEHADAALAAVVELAEGLDERQQAWKDRAEQAEAVAHEIAETARRRLEILKTTEAELAIAHACAACNTHGACSTPWPCEEAAECPGMKS